MAKKWVYLFSELDQAEKYVGGDWQNAAAGCSAARARTWPR